MHLVIQLNLNIYDLTYWSYAIHDVWVSRLSNANNVSILDGQKQFHQIINNMATITVEAC